MSPGPPGPTGLPCLACTGLGRGGDSTFNTHITIGGELPNQDCLEQTCLEAFTQWRGHGQQGRGHLGQRFLQLLRKSLVGGTPNLAQTSVRDPSFSTDLPNELAGAGLSHRLWTQVRWGDTERTTHLSGPKSTTLGTLRPQLSDSSEGFRWGPRSPLCGPWGSTSGLGCPRFALPVTDRDRHACVCVCAGGGS